MNRREFLKTLGLIAVPAIVAPKFYFDYGANRHRYKPSLITDCFDISSSATIEGFEYTWYAAGGVLLVAKIPSSATLGGIDRSKASWIVESS